MHKCMVPPDVEGTVISVVPDGEYTIDETLVTIERSMRKTKTLTMTQRWPIRVPRPVNRRIPASVPLVTGQRILDTMFPIAKVELRHSGRIWNGKDDDPASDRKMVRCGYYHLYRMRRAWK